MIRLSRVGAALVALGLLAFGVAAGGAERLRFAELYDGSGVLGLRFSDAASRLAGKPVVMRGFPAPPLKAEAAFFVLSQRPVSVCPFCQSDADWPQDIVVVYPDSGTAPYHSGATPVEVSGLLELGPKLDPATGFLSQVRLVGASVRPAS
ncbi:MAG TPA: hypothetical protein VIF11_08815 [Methylomirabilota bacterium]|jgi:hypothetical protein